ncbi:MAG: tail fiber protein [Pseudolabrys sp.]
MDFYLGQIGIYGFNFAPKGWAMCIGTILPIQQNTALFSLLGTTYGGNGTQTFALPDLRSRTPIGFDGNYPIGEMSGVENVTLLNTEMPQHTHLMVATSTTVTRRSWTVIFSRPPLTEPRLPSLPPVYGPLSGIVALNAQSLSIAGGSQPHSNLQPLLAVNFCIATTGYYPSRN